ncbi:MAG: Dam family site-specific DNA-(adenine-N6)-methyltransferase [Deltaproteobacteria bacterium]
MSSKSENIEMPLGLSSAEILRPPLRWAGGKSAIVKVLIPLMPINYNRYVEPMAGSAAFFFAVKPERALLADVNEDLINYFTMLRNDSHRLISSLSKLTASSNTYYSLREQQSSDFLERAIRFAYLNRLCWNGVYRVNSLGRFNVPIGSRLPQVLWSERHLKECSRALTKAQLSHSDVLDTLAESKPNDFFFIDPPYPKGANTGIGFNRYTVEKFTFEDHKNLAREINKLSIKSVKVMLILSDDETLVEPYRKFRKTKLSTKSLISCTGASRRPVSEIVLTNY